MREGSWAIHVGRMLLQEMGRATGSSVSARRGLGSNRLAADAFPKPVVEAGLSILRSSMDLKG
jgi:hypothetical protein